MSVRDRTADHDRAEREADDWIGSYSWSQQAGVPPDFNKIFRAMWIHGYMAGLDAARVTASAPADEYESVGWQYRFPSIWGGMVWRDSPNDYNGSHYTEAREISAKRTA